MSRLHSREDGMTLPELLVAISIAVIVSLAAFSLIETVMRRTAESAGRVEASQKGRAAMDTMTRQLRSQVCLSTTVPPVAAADTNSVSFYTDLSKDPSANLPPELHVLTYDATKKTITEYDYLGTGTAPTINYPPMTSPSRVRQLAQNVVPETSVPIFAYYAYNGADPPRPDNQLGTPLSAVDLGTVARIEISFRTLSPNSTTTRGSIVLQDQVYVRAADPNDPAPTPTCA